jgi:hypothetical protein
MAGNCERSGCRGVAYGGFEFENMPPWGTDKTDKSPFCRFCQCLEVGIFRYGGRPSWCGRPAVERHIILAMANQVSMVEHPTRRLRGGSYCTEYGKQVGLWKTRKPTSPIPYY